MYVCVCVCNIKYKCEKKKELIMPLADEARMLRNNEGHDTFNTDDR